MVDEASHESARASRKGRRNLSLQGLAFFPRLSHSPLVKLSRDFSRLPNMESLLTVENFSTIKPLIRGEGAGGCKRTEVWGYEQRH